MPQARSGTVAAPVASAAPAASAASAAPVAPVATAAPITPVAHGAPAAPAAPIPPAMAGAALNNADDWHALITQAGLKGPGLQLASHSAFIAFDDHTLRLSLPADMEHLRTDNLVRTLAQALATRLGNTPQIRFEAVKAGGDTLHQRNERQRSERQTGAEAAFLADPVVSQLLGQGGNVVPDSIRPLD